MIEVKEKGRGEKTIESLNNRPRLYQHDGAKASGSRLFFSGPSHESLRETVTVLCPIRAHVENGGLRLRRKG